MNIRHASPSATAHPLSVRQIIVLSHRGATWLKYCLTLFLICLACPPAFASQASQTLTLAVVPQFPPDQILRDWSPVLKRIEEQTGLKLKLELHSSIPDFEAAFLKGRPDVAYLNPYHAIMAHKKVGYTPIIRDDSQPLTGILVVRNDSPIRSLDDLQGSTLAFPAPNAFGASLYMRALLTEERGLAFTPRYVKTHSNVYRNVLARMASAGGGVRQTLDKEPPEVRSLLRVLYETPPSPPHPLVVHPRVSSKTREALQKAFLHLATQPESHFLLRTLRLSRPVTTSYDDYAPLDKLGLARFAELNGNE